MEQLHLFPCPFFRAGVALHFAVQGQHQLGKAAVVPARAYRVRQKREAGVRLRFFVAGVQHPLQGGALHGGGPVLVRNLEVRGKAQNVAVFPEHPGTEAVYGADLGLLAQGALPPQTAAARVSGQSLSQLLHDPAPQFPGGGPGEGDNQEAVDIRRILGIGNIGHEPFGEHSGLAAARSGGHQHGAAPCMDGGVLGRRGFKFTHRLCSSSSISQTWSAPSLGI